MTSYLVSGGAGSFGRAFVRTVLADPATTRVVVASRDEEKHRIMAEELGPDPADRLRFFLADVRDADRLRRAMAGVDTVVHAAALKQVPALEYNPDEAAKTNIDGTRNVISAAIDTPSVERVVLISSDKACAPHNLYGATKAVAEKLMVAANSYSGADGPKFCAVRYGNVFGSRGSVLHAWRRAVECGQPVPITDARMTRFFFTLDGAVSFVREVLGRTRGGEVWVPRLPSFRVVDLARALHPGRDLFQTGIRPGEKLHESMVSEDEGPQVWDAGSCYALCPWAGGPLGDRVPEGAVRVPEGFRYRSDENTEWLGVGDLRGMLAAHIEARGAA